MDDYPHQYNGISLGLTVYAVAAIVADHELLGSALFALAMNHKQMSAYYAPAFFAYLLGRCLRRERPLLEIVKLGAVVIGVFATLWAPFYLSGGAGWTGVLTVLRRLVPLQRGLYEDYVANFWCATAPAFKWKRVLSVPTSARVATFATIAALLPSALRTIKTPTKDAFLWCLSCSAFAFFLFSFQVHEKSALLPLLPATLLSLRAPTLAARLPLAVCFSCYPLLERDGLSLAYVGVMGAFASVIGGGAPPPPSGGGGGGGEGEGEGERERRWWGRVDAVSAAAFVVAHAAAIFVPPPASLPHLHALAFTSSAFVYFAGAAAYCHARLWAETAAERAASRIFGETKERCRGDPDVLRRVGEKFAAAAAGGGEARDRRGARASTRSRRKQHAE